MRLAILPLLACGVLLAETQAEEGARLFQTTCAVCHGSDGSAVEGVDFSRGRFKRGSTDEDLMRAINRGISGTGMPPFDFNQIQMMSLIAYLRLMPQTAPSAVGTGDAARGKLLFEGKGGCVQCHRAEETGSRTGPDLSDVGRFRSAASLQESILDPDAAVLPEHVYFRAITRAGVTITGRRLNEDPGSVQLIDSSERLVALNKADLREYTVLRTSLMPSYRGKLSAAEIADLVKYLSMRRGPR